MRPRSSLCWKGRSTGNQKSQIDNIDYVNSYTKTVDSGNYKIA